MKRSDLLKWGICLILTMLSGLLVRTAHADDDFWTAGTGDFNTGSNWSLGSPPGFFDDAYIDNAGTANYASGSLTMGLMSLGFNAGETGTLNVTGGTLAPSRGFIGQRGTGTATVNGGSFTVGGGSLFIGGTEGSGANTGLGILNISGGPTSVVTSGDDFQLGASGSGTLNMSGGYARGAYTVVGKFGTGLWNHSGGVYDELNGADIEIGDGGKPEQAGTPGPRTGTINLTGGVIRVSDHMGIGNRNGTGTVNVSGGALTLTGNPGSTLYVGRGMDWGANQGGPTTLRVTGDDAIIVANGNLDMNTSLVSTSSTLVAEITGPTHTPISVTGNALIANGNFKVELNGYTPISGDSWTIIEAGADLTADKAAIDAIVSGGGYPTLTHVAPGSAGTVSGPFLSTDFSMASLTPGLSWNVAYTSTDVVLSVTGTAISNGDYDNDGDVDGRDFLVWQRGGSPSPLSSTDLTTWQTNYGTPGPLASMTAVPEPSAVLLVVFGSILGFSTVRGRSK